MIILKVPFKKANILLPKNCDMTKWSVIACDQYTSEKEYWDKTKEIVGDSPSTLNLVLPEIYLEDSDVEERINSINSNMEKLLAEDFFKEYPNSLIYTERTQKDGKIKEGLMGIIDLEAYSYEAGSDSMIRATEKTVIERIPPRVKVRENASLELPHIMILIDDEEKDIIENIKNTTTEENKLYDFELMQEGGHVKGYLLKDDVADEIINKLDKFTDIDYFNNKYGVTENNPLVFAMGDGNHSLATAKTCYENLKKTMSEEEYLNHPARYALVELVNLHSDALEFEAIHRVVFDVDVNHLIDELSKYYEISYDECDGQKMTMITKDEEKDIYIKNPKSNIAVGSLQIFLDDYLKDNPGKVDYIHGDDATRKLAQGDNNIGFILPAMKKTDLFKSVIVDGALPRKTFSMGHSDDKRFYLEARKIK
ncbi:MAG: DUF1015 domain-containing protein [Bacilli bacterium]|nr:DUF1015 domain-containing protein [Bacilli bacterium]